MMNVLACAGHLMQEREQKGGFRSYSAAFGMQDIADAYAVQAEYVRLIQAKGEVPAGYKIGLTSKAMQDMTGIPHPIVGVVHAGEIRQSPAQLKLSDYVHLGLELEVAVHIGKSLSAVDKPLTMEDIAAAVDGVCVSIEIIDDRNASYDALDVLTLVADNSWNHGLVTSAMQASWPDLSGCAGRIYRNGKLESEGKGSAVLGHPFNPVVWLSEYLGKANQSLDAGTIVTTGNFVRTVFVEEPSHLRFEIDGIGVVDIEITD